MTRVPFVEVVAAVAALLTRHGCSAACARILAHNCVTAQRDGSDSHGLFRLKDYVATLQSGYVNGDPAPRVEDAAPGFVRVDADNGFAQVALEAAFDLTVRKARANGVAVLAIRNSHHTGALALDVERFAELGLLALSVVNSIPVVAAPGGAQGVYGTNPMAFAAPRLGAPPVVFDQAASTFSHGDVQVAARAGRSLPAGSGVDRHGNPTGDPQAILEGGALATFGGYKGASIALLVEILCAGLAGADFSFEVGPQAPHSKPAGATTARTGQTFVVIDPGTGAENLPESVTPFAARVDALLAALTAAGQSRLPGERRLHARQACGDTVRLEPVQWQALQDGRVLIVSTDNDHKHYS